MNYPEKVEICFKMSKSNIYASKPLKLLDSWPFLIPSPDIQKTKFFQFLLLASSLAQKLKNFVFGMGGLVFILVWEISNSHHLMYFIKTFHQTCQMSKSDHKQPRYVQKLAKNAKIGSDDLTLRGCSSVVNVGVFWLKVVLESYGPKDSSDTSCPQILTYMGEKMRKN